MVGEYATPEEKVSHRLSQLLLILIFKAAICAKLVLLAPPCEFNEVLDAQYNKDQMIHVKLPGCEHPSLITSYADLGSGYFMCPRSQQSFHFDHLKQTVSDVKSLDRSNVENIDHELEDWRHALQECATVYVNEHFPEGAVSVYALRLHDGARSLVLCIESHFSKHQSTGRWRSEWIFKVIGQSPMEFSVHGVIKVQVGVLLTVFRLV
ncbi:unnamed protein product [Trichobilharzia regenti]|nr:unnamed protein product [Trichobilharzia regenti]